MADHRTNDDMLGVRPQLLAVDDLVTGEAVALDLPAASLPVRLLSGLIDVIAAGLMLVAAFIVAPQIFPQVDDAIAQALGIVLTVGVLVALPVTIETLTRGRSLGKFILGLRVVRDDAGPVAFRQALARHLVGFLEIWLMLGVPALLCGMANQRSKRVGDFVAGTYAVRERFRLVLPPPVVMPWELQTWASTADVARLPAELSLAIRQFLARAHSFTPQARQEVGQGLVQRTSALVAPMPPAGTHPEAFLAAVLAERRRREADLLAAQRGQRQRLHDAVHQRATPSPGNNRSR